MSKMIAKAAAPRTSLRVTKENGGIISSTTLLTTYIPPQMLAAPSPLRIPTSLWFIRRRL